MEDVLLEIVRNQGKCKWSIAISSCGYYGFKQDCKEECCPLLRLRRD